MPDGPSHATVPPAVNINTPEELQRAEAWLPYIEDREP
jgi:GTP:adenosylcobinamide-phosphate guanylyltransferase